MQPPRLRVVRILAFLVAFASPHARAELRFTETTATLTTTTEAGTLTAHLPFQNTGATAVFIAGLTTSCPCTTAQTDKKYFAPNERGIVSVTYKIGAAEGPQSQTVTLLTNENDSTAYTLTVKADLPARPRATLPRTIPVSPTLLFWSKKPLQPKTVKVDLRGIEDAKIHATCASPAFKISIAQSSSSSEAAITLTPDATAASTRGDLLITVERGSEKIVLPPVPLTVQVK